MSRSNVPFIVFGIVVLIAAAAVGVVMLKTQAEETPAQQPSVPQTEEQIKKDFMANMNERSGIQEVKGTTVIVGPKFHTLSPELKSSALNLLSTRVFEVSAEGSGLKPDQVLTLVDAGSGKEIGTFSSEGLKMQ